MRIKITYKNEDYLDSADILAMRYNEYYEYNCQGVSTML